MNNNVIYPGDNPPGYTANPPPPGAEPSAPYGQSTLLYGGQNQPQPCAPPQPVWNDPSLNQQPPAGYGQYPPPYGQPMAAPYPQPGYYGAPPPPPPPQQQQQQQVVVVNNANPHPIIIRHETFVGPMIMACFVMWCCNCLFGLVAFILAG